MTVTATVRERAPYETSPRLYRFLKWLVSWIMRVLYVYRVEGQENVPRRGAFILAVNHLHLLDPVATAPAIPRQIVTLAAAKWEGKSLAGWFLRSAGTIFVRRGEVDRRALRYCRQVLDRGQALAIAPEGTRSKSHSLQRAKPGIAYLAVRTGVPILPVSVYGVEKLGAWRRFKRPTCRLVIGKPFLLPQVEGKITTERLQQFADLVMLRIGAALPESYRGVYAKQIAAIESGQSPALEQLVLCG